MDRRLDETNKSCFQLYHLKVESLLIHEIQRLSEDECQKTRIGSTEMKAALQVGMFLRGSKKVAVAQLRQGTDIVGVIGLSLYVQNATRAIVVSSSHDRVNELATGLGYPLRKSTFFENSKFFSEKWTMEEKNKFLPLCRVTSLNVPLMFFREEVAFVDGSWHGEFNAKEWVKRNLSGGFQFANLVIVDNAHFFNQEFWDAIIDEYKRKHPEGRLIFISAENMTYEMDIEAFNAHKEDS